MPVLLALVLIVAQASAEQTHEGAQNSNSGVVVRGAFEASAWLFDAAPYVGATPVVGLDAGEDFAAELGAPLRFRLPGGLRRADWDQASDYGQVLRALRLGKDDAGFTLRAGPLEGFTLGRGHLINRYGNRENADYHPSGAALDLALAPVRLRVLASDFLAARLFGAELSLSPDAQERWHLAVSAAADLGTATLAHADVDLALARGDEVRCFAFAGAGARVDSGPSAGALVGVSLDAVPIQLGGRLELRKQAGGFRQGFFGPTYEVSRFAGTGFSGTPLPLEALPDGFSAYAELAASTDDARATFSIAAEHFFFGRTDADFSLALKLFDGRATAVARGSVVGAGVLARYAATVEGRARVASALYVLAGAGTDFFPQPDETLRRGYHAFIGLGSDFER